MATIIHYVYGQSRADFNVRLSVAAGPQVSEASRLVCFFEMMLPESSVFYALYAFYAFKAMR
jgi:hypothetical protein